MWPSLWPLDMKKVGFFAQTDRVKNWSISLCYFLDTKLSRSVQTLWPVRPPIKGVYVLLVLAVNIVQRPY